jgi:hypothetical protein
VSESILSSVHRVSDPFVCFAAPTLRCVTSGLGFRHPSVTAELLKLTSLTELHLPAQKGKALLQHLGAVKLPSLRAFTGQALLPCVLAAKELRELCTFASEETEKAVHEVRPTAPVMTVRGA